MMLARPLFARSGVSHRFLLGVASWVVGVSLFCYASAGASGPPGFVSENHSATDGPLNSSTLPINIVGTDRLLIAAWHSEYDGGVLDWTVECAGIPGIELIRTNGYTGGNGNQRFRIYYWVNPPMGSRTVSVLHEETGANELAVSVILLTNVNQTVPLGALDVNVSTAPRTHESETVSTTTNDLVVHVIADRLFTPGILGVDETSRSYANDGGHQIDGDASLWLSTKPGAAGHTTVSSSGWGSSILNGVAIAVHGTDEPVTSPLTVTLSGQGTVSPDLNGQPLLVGNQYTLTAKPDPGFSFTGWTGDLASDRARFTFVMQSNLTLTANFADVTSPSVTILQPAASARLTNDTVVLQGTSADGNAVAAVEYRLSNAAGSGAFQTATGTTAWSATVPGLVPGLNQLNVRARDASGNLSTEAVRSVVLLTSLTVTTNAGGAVSSGFLGTTFRDPGKELTLLAIPRAGFVFSNWSGSMDSAANPLRFLPASNMTLEANFVVNPFVAVLGNYNGLFYVGDPTNGVRHESSGAISFLVSKLGSYSGHLLLAGRRLSFSGRFDLEGRATNTVKRTGTNALVLDLALDLGGGSDRVLGHVTDPQGSWSADLSGDRTPSYTGTNTSPYQGHYTLILTNRDLATPLGDSFGTVSINSRGRITLSGSLADNTPVAQSISISKDGQWPLYIALYGGKGSLLSWVVVDTNQAASISGALSWIRPSLPGAIDYPDGFISTQDIIGSTYISPGTNKVLQLDLGELSVEGGNLENGFTNIVALGLRNTVTNLTVARPLVLSLTIPNGLFKGTLKVNDGGVSKTLGLKGALLQSQNRAAGYFLGTNQSGQVQLQSAP